MESVGTGPAFTLSRPRGGGCGTSFFSHGCGAEFLFGSRPRVVVRVRRAGLHRPGLPRVVSGGGRGGGGSALWGGGSERFALNLGEREGYGYVAALCERFSQDLIVGVPILQV